MGSSQRKVAIITSLGKKYSGWIDIPSATFRTTDLFNSSHIYWKNPDIKCYDDAILLSNAQLYVNDKFIYQKFDMVQVKLSEIIYLYDDIEHIGDESEKKRASTLTRQVNENAQHINIITSQVDNSFYNIKGIFAGLFKKKTKSAFIPLTQARITEVYKEGDKWFKKKIKLPHNFICISSKRIESIEMKQD